MALMLATEVASSVIGLVYKNNHIVLPFYALAELLFFSYFYKNFFLKEKFNKTFYPLVILGSLFILSEVFYNFVLHSPDPHSYQPYSKTIDNTLIIFMAFAALNNKMSSGTARFGWDGFWFNIAVILFFTYNTIFFLPFNFMVNAPMEAKFLFWTSNTVSIIVFYGYLTARILRNALAASRVQV